MSNNTAQESTVVAVHLPVAHVNLIIVALAELPYKQVVETIQLVKQQAEQEILRQKSFMTGVAKDESAEQLR